MSITEEAQQEREKARQQLQSDFLSITSEYPEFKKLGKFESPREVEMIRHFAGRGIYSPREIRQDIQQIREEAEWNRKKDLQNGRERIYSDSKILEKALVSSIGKFDFFGESRFDEYDKHDEPLYEDPGFIIQVAPSLEYDDRHNHADLICTIQNPDTNQKPIIFAIDATFNIDKLHEKLYKNGKVGFRGRGGTGIQGFTRLKYYEGNDEENPYHPQTKSGMKERATGLVPLFTVGFSESLAATLGDEYVPDIKRQQAADHAAPIVIKELLTQTENNIEALSAAISANHPPIPTDRQNIALHKLKALQKYFEGAWEFCKNDKNRSKHTGSVELDTTASAIINAVNDSSSLAA